ncbi:MAG TPA: hypothetical protein VI462_12035 [Acidimicrobiia bacterium]|jgi:hypothetical protein
MTEQGIAGLDVQAIENEVSRLPEVVACRIVSDSLGHPVEVHVLAHSGKHPKQVVRDVQSVAMASFGVDIDRRIVSVVQLTPENESVVERDESLVRTTVGSIQSQIEGRRATFRVTLSSVVDDATGFAEGSTAGVTRLRLVASAILDALRQLYVDAGTLELDEAARTRVGSKDVVVVTIIRIEPPDETEFVGSALAQASPDVAAVYAVLDAVEHAMPGLAGGTSAL